MKEGKSGILSYGLYLMYRERFKNKIDKKCEANVSAVKWQRVCKKFNLRKMESIIKGEVFTMPFRLGEIGIVEQEQKIEFDKDGKLITKHLGIDWGKTFILWGKLYPECHGDKRLLKQIPNKPLVYYTNEHTDQRVFRFHWKKKNSNVKNKSAYAFVVAFQHKVALADYIKRNPSKQYFTKL